MSSIMISNKTMIKYLVLFLLILVGQLSSTSASALLADHDFVSGEPTFYSYESSSNFIDDGQNVVTQLKESNFDSTKSSQPVVKQRIYVSPSSGGAREKINGLSSGSESLNKIISRNQILSNEITPGLFRSFEVPVKSYHKSRGFRRGYLTSARTVESPALSVDSGGQASTSLAKELAKVFNVKQGFYSGIYDNMENRIKKPTRRPPEIIEDNARELIEEMFEGQNRQSHNHHRSFNSVL